MIWQLFNMISSVVFYLIIWAWVFFLLYVGSMNIMHAYHNKKLNVWLYILCSPYIVFSWIYDVLSNLTIISIIYLELPRQLTFTDRLKRHVKSEGWRANLSNFICKKILSPLNYTKDHCD